MSVIEEEYQALIQEDMAVEENSGSRTTVITQSADVLRQLEIMQIEIKQLLEQQQQQQLQQQLQQQQQKNKSRPNPYQRRGRRGRGV